MGWVGKGCGWEVWGWIFLGGRNKERNWGEWGRSIAMSFQLVKVNAKTWKICVH